MLYYNKIFFIAKDTIEVMNMSNKIVETVKENGEIAYYILSNGETINKAEGVNRAKNGEIEGVIVAHSRKGEEYLRTKPDGTEGNNLSSITKNN